MYLLLRQLKYFYLFLSQLLGLLILSSVLYSNENILSRNSLKDIVNLRSKTLVIIKIFSSDDNKPLPYPIAQINQKSFNKICFGSSDGIIKLYVAEGKYDFNIRRYGFRSKSLPLSVTGTKLTIDVYLDSVPIEQPSISITGT